MLRSSSTTSTRPRALIGSPLGCASLRALRASRRHLGARQRDADRGAERALAALDAHDPAVLGDHAMHDREAQPGAAGLGGEERVEDAIHEFPGNAGTLIHHGNLGPDGFLLVHSARGTLPLRWARRARPPLDPHRAAFRPRLPL